MSKETNILKEAYLVEGDWGIKNGEWDSRGEWYHGPPDYTIIHKCPLTTDSSVSCLERWDMKTIHWKCPGCNTAPSERIITLWKLMGGTSLLWEDPIPEGTDLESWETRSFHRGVIRVGR